MLRFWMGWMKPLLRLTLNVMLVVNSMVISLAPLNQEEIDQHLCWHGGTIDTSGADLRPGVIDYFMKQNVQVNGHYVTSVLASVRWFQAHPSRYSLGAPVEVWCKDLFEPEGESTFIPIQRISGKFIPAIDILQDEHVLVVCPLTRKLQC